MALEELARDLVRVVGECLELRYWGRGTRVEGCVRVFRAKAHSLTTTDCGILGARRVGKRACEAGGDDGGDEQTTHPGERKERWWVYAGEKKGPPRREMGGEEQER